MTGRDYTWWTPVLSCSKDDRLMHITSSPQDRPAPQRGRPRGLASPQEEASQPPAARGAKHLKSPGNMYTMRRWYESPNHALICSSSQLRTMHTGLLWWMVDENLQPFYGLAAVPASWDAAVARAPPNPQKHLPCPTRMCAAPSAQWRRRTGTQTRSGKPSVQCRLSPANYQKALNSPTFTIESAKVRTSISILDPYADDQHDRV